MSVTVVGSVALDTVIAPRGTKEEGLGGTATFFSLAASHFTKVYLVGIVGTDFPQEHIDLLAGHGVDLDGLEQVEGETFRWTGKYHDDMNIRDTLDTQLNVFEHFHPKLTEAAAQSKYLFLGNIQPTLQLEVLEQASAEFVALDTMNLWIDIALDDLKKVLAKVDAILINDQEVEDLTGERNLVVGAGMIREMGPGIVVIKKGEHGCLLFEGDRIFAAPALPMAEVLDPTGAGDTFAGGFLGYIARQDTTDSETLRKAVVYGSVVASFTCEQFATDRLSEINREDIDRRFAEFAALTAF